MDRLGMKASPNNMIFFIMYIFPLFGLSHKKALEVYIESWKYWSLSLDSHASALFIAGKSYGSNKL